MIKADTRQKVLDIAKHLQRKSAYSAKIFRAARDEGHYSAESLSNIAAGRALEARAWVALIEKEFPDGD